VALTIMASEAAKSNPAMLPSRVARPVFLLAILAATAAGFLMIDSHMTARAVANAGADLTRLLRAMAVIKTMLAAGAVAAVLWRLGGPVSLTWFAAYALCAGAMAMGPGLIWTMAHVGTGAILLHGGLLATLLLLWRDPAVARRLAELVRARRRALSPERKLQA
jgi:hypothetical protein